MARPIETVDIETNQVEQPAATTINDEASTQAVEQDEAPQQADEPIVEQTEAVAKPVKARGHRPKQPDKPDMRAKTTCPDCNKQVSLHTLKFKHAKTCKGQQSQQPQQLRQSQQTTNPQPTQQPEQIVQQYAEQASSSTHHLHHQPVDTHAMVIEHVRAMKQQKQDAKQAKYKQLLAGKL